MLGIDFVAPNKPPAADGSVYILTITVYFAKWVEAVPTTNKVGIVCSHVSVQSM